MHPGASTEGTSRYTTAKIDEGIPPHAFRTLGRTGLRTSALGFGSYRISCTNQSHVDALTAALLGGCNLVDTSANYGDGSGERCIGNVLKTLQSENKIERDQIIVVSKVGYVQGNNLKNVIQKEKDKKPYPDMVKYQDGCWHCIHPDFISDQITESLSRLQTENIDVYLLHNPEYFLMHTINVKPELKLDKVRDLYYDRITRAFRKLEEEVESGRIGCYGVSSNTFGTGIHENEHTNVELLWDIACHVAKDRTGNPYQHHFSVVQMPANLLETGAMLEPNCDDGSKTAIEFSAEKELAVLVNRPLNAIRGNHMIRLAEMKSVDIDVSLKEQIKIVSTLEEEFKKTMAPHIQTEGGPKADELFGWGKELGSASLKGFGLEQWKHIEHQVIRPQVSNLCHALDQQMQGELAKVWADWRNRYLPNLIKLLEVVHGEFTERTEIQIKEIKKRVNKHLPEALKKQSFSRRALSALINTKGISCVLNGMRSVKYVEDSLGALSLDKFEMSKEAYGAISS